MKRLDIYIMLVMLLLGQSTADAKGVDKNQMKGDYLYQHFAFHEAIPYYKSIAENAADVDVYSKLGDCYLLTKNPDSAIKWYSKAVSMDGCTMDVKLRYAKALMAKQRYYDAIPYLEAYHATYPEDRRVENMIKSSETAEASMKELPVGYASFLSFNTDGSEFGPHVHGEELIFTTDSAISHRANNIDKWTGSSYNNIYAIPCNENGRCKTELNRIGGKINTKYHDGPAVFNTEGSKMYFTRTNYSREFITNGSNPDDNGVVRLQIMIADDYDSSSKEFKKVKPFKYNNKNYSTAHPALSADGNMLVFTSDMPDGEGGSDLYMCTKDVAGNWSEPQSLGKVLNTEGEEMFPFLSDDNKLYFSSNGHVGLGGLDVYVSNWDANTKTFSEPQNVGMPVNSSYDDMSLTLYQGSSDGYFASNRPAEKKGDNIYYINMRNVYLSLMIKDAASGTPIAASSVSFSENKDNRTFTSGSGGKVFTRILPQTSYTVTIKKPGYKTQTIDVSTFNAMNNDTVSKEVLLESDFAIYYNAIVMDESTYTQIENPMIVYAKLGEGSADTAYLNGTENFTISLDPDAEYNIYAVKDKYYSSERMVSTAGIIQSMGVTKVRDTLFMKELKIGEVYKIDNIYYDYDKANIREDAKPALNGIIQMLGQYEDMSIQINSHTDCRGSAAYNKNLSRDRAASVIRYLQQRGISKSRLQSKGFGETKPVETCNNCDDCTDTQHQRNRRTEFQIITM